MRDECLIRKYCEADVIALAECYAKQMVERKNRQTKRKIKCFIIRSLDFIAVMSWLIGACALDCETNDMRIVFAMLIIPMLWGILRVIAEGEWR